MKKISFKLIAGLIAVVSIALFQACIPNYPPGGGGTNCPSYIPPVNGTYTQGTRGDTCYTVTTLHYSFDSLNNVYDTVYQTETICDQFPKRILSMTSWDSTAAPNEVVYTIEPDFGVVGVLSYYGTYTIDGCGNIHFTFNRLVGNTPINPAIECTGKFTAGAPDKVVMNTTPDHAGVPTFNKQ